MPTKSKNTPLDPYPFLHLKADRPRLIHIVGMGLGKSTLVKLLKRWYQSNSHPFIILSNESGETPEHLLARVNELSKFKGFIILATQLPVPGLVPWQTINFSGGIDAGPPPQ